MEVLRNNAYTTYIGQCRRDECLGWEGKLDRGLFGIKELEAHKDSKEMLGFYRAYTEVLKMINDYIVPKITESVPSRDDK